MRAAVPGPVRVRAGVHVSVRVPGSSANLGPGFDSMGLALGFHNEVRVEVLDEGDGSSRPGAEVCTEGDGADSIATDERNLVVQAMRTTFDRAHASQPRLRLRCTNGIPFGRGIGSSAAAVVSGVVAARAVLEQPERLDDELAVQIASDLEGHPDNASASLLGGLTLGWSGAGGARAIRVDPHPDIVALVCLPSYELATSKARAMLPGTVPHADAAHTAGRAALLVEALTRRPELLLPATVDRLHQLYRAPAMPATAELIELLRQHGHAAVVSGAGPSVLVLGPVDTLNADTVSDLAGPEWVVASPGIDTDGAIVNHLRD